ncbi:unnamed protein product [Meloidogyne enterolobii]|uniref:Uncharacterized protein n=1 Tax=Meloidogyne enterolobii TaxID=390850 RepID=A0ACB1A9U6_MELEN
MFDYDSVEFELDFNDIDVLAATPENMFGEEFLLECKYEEKAPPNSVLSSKHKKRLAIHERGHIFVAYLVETDVTKVTIKSEGNMLGHYLQTLFLF